MTRPKPSLHQHLLTRSDLARLQVPAGDVLSWLANGTLEQVGVLPDDGDGDPVFTVLSNRLRQELALRLIEVGKPTVVLTPLRVRSFLLRALLTRPAAPGVTGDPLPADPHDEQALAEVLQEVVAEVVADVAEVERLAAEEAQLEAAASDGVDEEPRGEAPTSAPVEAGAMPEATTAEPAAAEPARETCADDEQREGDEAEERHATDATDATDEDPCFDVDDLANTLDGLEPSPEPADAPIQLVAAAPPPAAIDPIPTETEAPMVSETPTLVDEPAALALAVETAAPAVDSTPAAEAATAEPLTTTVAATVDAPDVTAEAATPAAAGKDTDHDAPAAEPEPTSPPIAATAGAAPTAAPQAVPAHDPTAAIVRTMERVETFLGQMQQTLVELTQRPAPAATAVPVHVPAPAAVDVAPLVQAVNAGFERSVGAMVGSSATLTQLGDKVQVLGTQIEQSVDKAVQAMHAAPPAAAPVVKAEPVVSPVLVARTDRTPWVLLALAALVATWSIVFWVKTGSARLALGTLVGANLVGCCLLASWRSRA